MLSLALVGGAHIHTPGFLKILQKRASVKLAAVWDHDAARAQRRAAEAGGAQVVDDVAEIWRDPQIRAVIICSETNRHESLVCAAAQAGKHLFVEKPLGIGAADAHRMANAIERAGAIFQTGYVSRGWPPILWLRQHVQQGTFGKITRARASICHSGALGGWFDSEWRWMADLEQAGVGAFGDLGTHGLDILIWLLGEVESVTAALDPGTGRYPNCDETGEALLRFKNGTIATLAAAWDDLANPVQYLISGTEAHAAIIQDELYVVSHKLGLDGKTPIKAADCPKGWPHPLDLFLDAVEGGAGQTPPGSSALLVGAQEAAYRSAVMEKIYLSARSRAWVAGL
ncbi:Gfo/Idh/MocA family protein [Fontivita pretiosa]|uniref:Gfo/Idh/MocA family protein n=1 Tax=Fontivita pretiosa TaxID=2989684 RepID=UPI003D1648E0